ncbi:M64 family metallopeptidase [Minwuia sp.]|uniref:M64 family metallopeptidase n=1 Tax=Minwuia sp. TaxID=2493630 RepID=UPI003A8E983F
MEQFLVRLPIVRGMASLRLSASPPDARGVRHDLGGPAEVVGVYRVPEHPVAVLQREDSPVLPFDVCGDGRGQVVGMTTLLSHGPSEDVFNLAILAEGFKADQQDRFMSLARRAVNTLMGTPPLRRAVNAQNINIHAIRVASKSDKFSEPDQRYFGVVHPEEEYPTYIEWNQSCVRAVGDYFGISFDWLALIVNESRTRFGTAYNQQFGQSISQGWERVFVHEFGHTAFGLRDEYSGDRGSYPGSNSSKNLTSETDRENIPWAALIEDNTPIPTLGNPPGCTDPGQRPSPVAPDKVGLFAGGLRYACDIYHSQHTCIMNSSDTEPDFCRVCYNRAIEVFLAAPRVIVPVPAIAHYSKLDEGWSTPRVAADIIAHYGPDKNRPDFDDILAELLSGRVGPALQARLGDSHVRAEIGATIYQGDYDAGNRAGHWHLFCHIYPDYPHSINGTVFVFTGTTELSTVFGFHTIDLVDFPKLTRFDSVPLGIDTILFAASGNVLESGRLDSQARLQGDGMQIQFADGLESEVTDVSSVEIRPRAFVSVVDALRVKMGVYQFASESWSAEGFVTLAADPDREFRTVRSTVTDGKVAVLSSADDGLHVGVWDAKLRAWTGPAVAGPAASSPVTQFDIAAIGTRLAVVWYEIDAARLMLSIAEIDSLDWSAPTDMTERSGFPADAVITDLAAAALDPNLHIVALADDKALHAIGDISLSAWQTFAEVPSLLPLQNTIAALTLHADDPQLFLGLSEGRPISEETEGD